MFPSGLLNAPLLIPTPLQPRGIPQRNFYSSFTRGESPCLHTEAHQLSPAVNSQGLCFSN